MKNEGTKLRKLFQIWVHAEYGTGQVPPPYFPSSPLRPYGFRLPLKASVQFASRLMEKGHLVVEIKPYRPKENDFISKDFNHSSTGVDS